MLPQLRQCGHCLAIDLGERGIALVRPVAAVCVSHPSEVVDAVRRRSSVTRRAETGGRSHSFAPTATAPATSRRPVSRSGKRLVICPSLDTCCFQTQALGAASNSSGPHEV